MDENEAKISSLVEEMAGQVAEGNRKREALLEMITENQGNDDSLRQLELQDELQAHAQIIQSISNVMKASNDAIKGIIAHMK